MLQKEASVTRLGQWVNKMITKIFAQVRPNGDHRRERERKKNEKNLKEEQRRGRKEMIIKYCVKGEC
jgi:hypothetical protein